MRLKLLLSAICLFGGFSAASAQTHNESTKQRLRSQYLQNDTAQAIINLYSRKQGGGAGWIVGSALGTLRVVTAGNSSPNNSPYLQNDNSGNVAAVLTVFVPMVGYGISKLARFSNGHLEKVLAAYAAGQPLPHNLRRKLKPKLFKEQIVKYKPVKAEDVK